jgi:hypothetical protein
MRSTRLLRTSAALASVLALSAVAAQASNRSGDDRDRGWSKGPDRMLVATTNQNQLLTFNARNPDRIKDIQAITGLPSGVTLRGIDFRPKTGDLYGVGSDSVVYRVNPGTGIAIAEGPAFTPALNGQSYGVDFNPVVDKIRVVSDAGQNLRLNPDEGTVLMQDGNLNPGMPQVVAAGYENSSFSFTQPTATTLHVIDAASDQLFTQNPPNNGTLTNPRKLRIDVGPNTGFDVAGANNLGYLTDQSRRGTELYTVDLPTGKTKSLGRIGGGRRLVVTGLAAWQD